MRSKQAVLTGLLLSLTLPIGACTNLERAFAPDPLLQGGSPNLPGTLNGGSPAATASLPADFPAEIPQYPGAILQAVTAPTAGGVETLTQWSTTDTSEQVQQFYQQRFQTEGWQVQSSTSPENISATRDGLSVTVAIAPQTPPATQPSPNPQASPPTSFILSYGRNATATLPSPQVSPTAVPQPGDPNFIGPVLPPNQVTQASPTPVTSTPESPSAAGDVQQAPPQLQPYITDLLALGALPLTPGGGKSVDGNFQPNKEITRREFARWLATANNTIFANRPANQVRLGTAASQPAFQDVPPSDPDFGVIQGLAEAGIIPSRLSGDTGSGIFQPDAPLARQTLVLWKVPLDVRRSLPNATVDGVQQTWGFQDANQINPRALRAVQADYQNGEQSNIRRAFGFTTLFQPGKPVTRAEAAAALWFFGTQGDGLSAKDSLQTNRQPN